MNRKDLLNKMRDSIGTKDPLEFFGDMVEVFDMMFSHMEEVDSKLKTMESEMARLKKHTALAIQWEPKVASTMIGNQVKALRDNKELYSAELSALKNAYVENKVTQSYQEFCEFWEKTMGWHPFLD